MEKSVQFRFLISSEKLKLTDVSEFKVGIELINSGDEPIPFDVSKTQLLVNRKPNISWDLAVQNGTLINMKVEPGKSQKVEWSLGEALFETPGTYYLDLKTESDTFKKRVIIYE